MIAGYAFLTQILVLVAAADSKSSVVVRVDGIAITAADLEFATMQQKTSLHETSVDQEALLEQLIDRQLLRALLASKKIEPSAEDLKQQITQAETLIRKSGEDPQKLLAKIGYSPDRLKRELGLPLAWQVYARRTITPDEVKSYFQQHQQELDGTQLRGSQIFLKLPPRPEESQVTEKKKTLTELRSEITAGKISFADAARQHSEAPSREKGGDVGLFGWRGKLPSSVSHAAFSLKINEISEPIVTSFGVHLIQVTERHPGEFSVEDVRSEIVETLSQQLWKATVAREREKAKIVREKSKL